MRAKRAQTAPEPFTLEDFLPYRLSVAANAVSKRIASAYARNFGLSIPEWRLIAVLSARGAATQQELVHATQMDKVAVSRAARALARKGHVSRQEDAADARALSLALTAQGHALFAQIAPEARAQEAAIIAHFTLDETRQLKALLARLTPAAMQRE
jgi:DNA-binding MarR family transcriptional regulator